MGQIPHKRLGNGERDTQAKPKTCHLANWGIKTAPKSGETAANSPYGARAHATCAKPGVNPATVRGATRCLTDNQKHKQKRLKPITKTCIDTWML